MENKKSYIKSVISLGAPILLGNLFTYLISFTDHLMCAGLGAAALGGIFLANQVGQLIQYLSVGTESTVAILGARAAGERDEGRRSTTVVASLLYALLISLSITLVCIIAPRAVLLIFSTKGEFLDTGVRFLKIYALSFPLFMLSRVLICAMRAVGYTRPSVTVPLLSFLLNLALNYVLIGGRLGAPALGVVGSAVATLAARGAELLFSILFLFLSPRGKGLFRWEDFKRPALFPLIRRSLPVMAGQLVLASNNFLFTAVMSRAALGAATVSLSVANSLYNLAYTLMNAISSSTGIITATILGRRSRGEQVDFSLHIRRSLLSYLAVGFFGAVLMLISSSPMISLYGLSRSEAELARDFILVLALLFIPMTVSAAALFGIIKSSGNFRFVFLVDLGFFLLFTLPLGLAGWRLGLSPTLLLIILRLDQLLKCPLAVVGAIRTGHRALDKSEHTC